MIYQDFKPCPICGASGQIPYANCTDFTVSKESYTLMRCPSCGVVYTLDPPSEDEMDRYDKVNLKLKLGDSPSGLIGRLYYRVRTRMLRKKARIVESQAYRTGGSLLNYGAKTGFFSYKMEKRGWKVTSVEKYHEERLFSLEMFHHRMIDVPEMDALHAGTFDVITMWHVRVAPSGRHTGHGLPEYMFDRCHVLRTLLGCVRCTQAPVAFQPRFAECIGIQTRIHAHAS